VVDEAADEVFLRVRSSRQDGDLPEAKEMAPLTTTDHLLNQGQDEHPLCLLPMSGSAVAPSWQRGEE
jgi:hypothetical protein